MSELAPSRRFPFAIELVVCTLVVGAVAVNAMRRMDYFGARTAQHIRMTDESRSAYVAKNIADGNGYATNDLPAALVDFYDHHGKLHDKYWTNADRFPFAAYATSVLYRLTGSTSWKVGIFGYNLVAFVAFLVVLYAFSRALWRDRYAALGALTLALIHAYTFQFLYWKDGDMLLLTTLLAWALYRYFQKPDGMTWRLSVGLGSLLAFVFLSRPNLGAAFILVFLGTALRRMWRARELRRFASRELLALVVAFAWCVPFMLQSLREWGTPLFSANSIYQLPLGTRFGMGTDTWWKYTEPGNAPTLARLLHSVPDELASKFTSSWTITLKQLIGSYFIELVLACGMFFGSSRGGQATGEAGDDARALRLVAWTIAFAFVSNLALLPLYGYQEYSYRHYLGFALPLVWLCAGRTLAMLCELVRPTVRTVLDHARAHRPAYALAIAVGLVGWNLGAPSASDASRLFTRTTRFVEAHWLVIALAFVLVLGRRWFWRPPWYPRVVAAALVLVFVCYRPNLDMKRTNLIWFPANDKVWDAMRGHDGVVSSFALQGEVAWNTGRKNIPAPEWPMEIYSYAFDHGVEIDDLYIESADAQLSPIDGPFSHAAPGFEGYARLQHYRTMPGYSVAFHDESVQSYAKFRIKAHPKASTVYHLTDRASFAAIAHGPDRIALGDPGDVIYTAHGWGDYFELDGKRVVAATDATRTRYVDDFEGPWEDASVTMFLDARRPRSVELDFYAPAAATFQFYWNLDLYEWDAAADRAAHQIGAVTTNSAGWQHVKLDVPARLTRNGLNKLGFRTSALYPTVMCPAATSDSACMTQIHPASPTQPDGYATDGVLLRPQGVDQPQVIWLAMLAGDLVFRY